MDIAALVISGLAAIIAGLGTILANRRANQALRESRKAVTTALWSAVQEAVQRLVGFDPTTEPVGERLANLRITMIDLAASTRAGTASTSGSRPNASSAQPSDGKSWTQRSPATAWSSGSRISNR